MDGNAVLRARAGKSEIIITTTNRLAGAIHSLTWNGKEFIDSTDHGRQLQSASNLDCGKDMIAETFNPTEAGSRADGVGEQSSSRLLRIRTSGAELETTVRMAFWLRPGEKSEGHPARNKKVLSDHLISKRVHIGHRSLAHAIEYDVTFAVPRGEKHTFAQFEAVTGYMPAEFRRFWKYDAGSGDVEASQRRTRRAGTSGGIGHAVGITRDGRVLPGSTVARIPESRLRALSLQGGEGGQVELRLPPA